MGRRKLEIKRIEDKSARQVTFSKRRNGLLKKAKELSVLCDVDVAVIIVSGRGRPYHYSSTNSLTEIVQQYQNRVDVGTSASAGGCESQEKSSKHTGMLTSTGLLRIVERELGDTSVDELSVTDLVHLEKQLETALIRTRSTKTRMLLDSLAGLREEEKMLVEEKKRLEEKIDESKNNNSRPNKLMMDLNVIAEGQTA